MVSVNLGTEAVGVTDVARLELVGFDDSCAVDVVEELGCIVASETVGLELATEERLWNPADVERDELAVVDGTTETGVTDVVSRLLVVFDSCRFDVDELTVVKDLIPVWMLEDVVSV